MSEFKWQNEPNNRYWDTTITLVSDRVTSLDEAMTTVYVDLADCFEVRWSLNHRGEFPIYITEKAGNFHIKTKSVDTVFSFESINIRMKYLENELKNLLNNRTLV